MSNIHSECFVLKIPSWNYIIRVIGYIQPTGHSLYTTTQPMKDKVVRLDPMLWFDKWIEILSLLSLKLKQMAQK